LNERQRWYQRLFSAIVSTQDEVNGEVVQVSADPEPSLDAGRMYQSSLLMNVLALLMFGGPHIHTKSLRDMALDWG
jgi:hypothetical protein